MRSSINHLMRLTKEDTTKNRGKPIFDEIRKGTFLRLMKYMGPQLDPQLWEEQSVPNRMNKRKTMFRPTVAKPQNLKVKEKF